MRIAPAVGLSEQQRKQLETNVRGRSLSARLVERSRIVLLAADGARDSDIAAALSITPHKAARWRSRFLALGLAGLQEDAARPGRPVLIGTEKIQSVVTKATQELPPNATHWSTRTMAAAAGLSEASVRRIWHAHGLKPHLVEGFKLSDDPRFGEKLEDIVALYLNPPEHALVLSLDGDCFPAHDKLSQSVQNEGRSYPGFNLFDADDEALFSAVARGEFNISGMQNKALRRFLPEKNSGQVSRFPQAPPCSRSHQEGRPHLQTLPDSTRQGRDHRGPAAEGTRHHPPTRPQ